MDLPTYTSIWRIEKRLYKLYDFRLPMPLPIGQVTVFAAIAVPYLVLLTVLGLPFTPSSNLQPTIRVLRIIRSSNKENL